MAPESINPVHVYKALGDDIRLGMVRSIASSRGPVASYDVIASCSSMLSLAQPTISHLFAKLVASGVLSEEKQGAQKLYRLNHSALEQAGIDIHHIK